jgi:hypothetical protein
VVVVVVVGFVVVVVVVVVVVGRTLLLGVGALVYMGRGSDRRKIHCRLCLQDIGNIVPKCMNNRIGHNCRVDIRSC